MNSFSPYRLLVAAEAPKCGGFRSNASGSIGFRVVADADQNLYIGLTSNSSSGVFSKELTPASKIRDRLTTVVPEQAFPSKVLVGAFKSKSANQPGFVCCVLRALGLIRPADNAPHVHVLAGDWDAWEKSMLALLPGEPIELDGERSSASAPPPEPEHRKGKKAHLKAGKGAGAPPETQGEDHADPDQPK